MFSARLMALPRTLAALRRVFHWALPFVSPYNPVVLA